MMRLIFALALAAIIATVLATPASATTPGPTTPPAVPGPTTQRAIPGPTTPNSHNAAAPCPRMVKPLGIAAL